MGGAGGSGGCGPLGGATLAKQGKAGAVLLRGTVVAPAGPFLGEVLVVGDTLACVAPSCAASPGAADASVVETNGIILPGMIDTHNHILFDFFDERQWTPAQAYSNHNQWVKEKKYGAMLDVKQYLNGEGGSPADFGCEMDKYGELKGLVAGTTSIVGAANPGNRACFGSLARTIDEKPNGLPADKVQTSALFPPTTASADGVCSNFASGKTDAYLVHCGEGVDAATTNEFYTLGTVTTEDGCLYSPKTTLVHGTAFGDPELTAMAQHGMSLVWSPKVNVFLYGGGVDLTKTPKIPLALQKGINVTLAPDWSIGGSQNLLDELRFADHLDAVVFGDVITPKMLFEMVTINPARALHLDSVLGSLEVGKKADLFVLPGDPAKPYDALLAATPMDVELVMVAGVALYGDPALEALGPAVPGCEALDVCCRSKFVCFAAPGGTATNKLGQTFVDVRDILVKAVADYDAMKLSPWTWSPITPVVRCP
jgi:cytosine/adenosine deaminase-related metal-dependent hydrolase